MARRGSRGLRPEERALWKKVADTATPLTKQGPAPELFDPPKSIRQISKPAPEKKAKIEPFQIGSKLRTSTAGHDLSSGISDSLRAQPLRMDQKSFAKMKRGKSKPEARIDLHGMVVADAQAQLTRFILTAHSAGKRLVLVITGKGRRPSDDGPIPQRHGVLRHQVPQWLSTPPLSHAVLQVSEAHQRHGGSGAYYVYLARRR